MPHPQPPQERATPIRAAVILVLATFGWSLALHPWAKGHSWPVVAVSSMSTLALSLLWYRRRLGRWFASGQGSLRWGVGAGIAIAALTYPAYALAAQWFATIPPEVDVLYARLREPPGVVAALPVMAVAVLAEEIIWRGVAFEELCERMTMLPAAISSIALYTLPHVLSGSWLLMLVALGVGTVWTALRVRTGALVAPTVCHLIWDLTVFVWFPLE